jgi:hypothetical protein
MSIDPERFVEQAKKLVVSQIVVETVTEIDD